MRSIIKVDQDTNGRNPELKDTFSMLSGILPLYGVRSCEIRSFATARGRHIYIELDREISNFDIVMIQLLLGSDPKRELFNLERLIQQKDHPMWNVLFKAKYRNGEKVSFETPELDATLKLTQTKHGTKQKLTIKRKYI